MVQHRGLYFIFASAAWDELGRSQFQTHVNLPPITAAYYYGGADYRKEPH